MKKRSILWIAVAINALMTMTVSSRAHCQIPCGTYDDEAQFKLMLEHVATIQKSVHEISKEKDISEAQRIRWVMNKENHADKIQKQTLDYFLSQRIKPEQKNYEEQLAAIHRIILLAMKCKQTVDAKIATQLEEAVLGYQTLYAANEE